MNCKDCTWWTPIGAMIDGKWVNSTNNNGRELGWCQKYAPKISEDNKWPEIAETDGKCGEFECELTYDKLEQAINFWRRKYIEEEKTVNRQKKQIAKMAPMTIAEKTTRDIKALKLNRKKVQELQGQVKELQAEKTLIIAQLDFKSAALDTQISEVEHFKSAFAGVCKEFHSDDCYCNGCLLGGKQPPAHWG